MVKMAELTGHTSRVLYMAQSPDGCTVASAAGDETLRFWNVFGVPEVAKTAPKVNLPNSTIDGPVVVPSNFSVLKMMEIYFIWSNRHYGRQQWILYILLWVLDIN
ncbi:hypothetical protein Goshw_003880 [Gossypium schwendimanii]|uniref:Anaphase-promoting complex subunit 4 WD40 domain-containing protein n=1 Tax=Gossypium schwendimanii TaxID=34291 RepID=A0A7J9N1H0_GOSSC|nr:hypothetical protein [Gossypium schwendimanii]